eukprot:gnl/TRDRNA2_/TRDRNA2_176860_c5_seq8.p1 gnl/TRDRNA2_/TRDRNA2_176860_c5~~gnl/TRDRNA2_/TRDRNA2_176860_c5_seq8.p1  ORF type:complete len:138 (+),score=11.85 gnl/TRDRNA2_/TRDRNA2_176860_c5_seq8:461-874(+)
MAISSKRSVDGKAYFNSQDSSADDNLASFLDLLVRAENSLAQTMQNMDSNCQAQVVALSSLGTEFPGVQCVFSREIRSRTETEGPDAFHGSRVLADLSKERPALRSAGNQQLAGIYPSLASDVSTHSVLVRSSKRPS